MSRAEGIPTYAVETVRALIDRDLVVPRGGAYVLADPDALDLDTIGAPASLQALISARLDRLDPRRAPRGRPGERRRRLGGAGAARRAVCRRLAISTHVLSRPGARPDLLGRPRTASAASRAATSSCSPPCARSPTRPCPVATASRRICSCSMRCRATTPPSWRPWRPSTPWRRSRRRRTTRTSPSSTERAVDLLRRAAARAHALGAPREAAGHLGRALDLVGEGHERYEIQLAQAMPASTRHGTTTRSTSPKPPAWASGTRATPTRRRWPPRSRADPILRGRDEGSGRSSSSRTHLRRWLDARGDPEVLYQLLVAYNLATPRVGRVDYLMFFEQVKLADRLRDRAEVARAIINLGVTDDGDRGPRAGRHDAGEGHRRGPGVPRPGSARARTDEPRLGPRPERHGPRPPLIIDAAVEVARRERQSHEHGQRRGQPRRSTGGRPASGTRSWPRTRSRCSPSWRRWVRRSRPACWPRGARTPGRWSRRPRSAMTSAFYRDLGRRDRAGRSPATWPMPS